MKKRLIAVAVCLATCCLAVGAHSDELSDMYFTGKNPELTQQEKDAIAVVKRWEAGTAHRMKPIVGADGSLKFVFGVQQISVVCAVLQVCDIALQPGEMVNGVPHLGDPRWTVDATISGRGPNEVQHIIVKPFDIGLETTMIITTNRRTYHIQLRSHKKDYMPKVSFIYADEVQTKWDVLQHREEVARENNTIPKTGEYLGSLDFDYKLTGNARWKPLRVYNDGIKTIIQMPSTMNQTEAPTLLVIRGKSDKDTVMVNYRVQGYRYIVDSVFDKAILIAGVGSKQDLVKITRGK